MAGAKCDKYIEATLKKMTLEEKISLCHGYDGAHIGNIPRLGIPEFGMADGPQGLRLEDGRTATALPCGVGLACSWSPDTAYEYGKILAEEFSAAGYHSVLGPGVNIMRTPLNGRNFEYFGEDPVLAGRIAAGYIRGCQENGVAATPKHLALNNQEICRTTGSSNIDERSLREIYLTAFEIAVKESGPWMMMSSYNKINGVQASACGLVQDQIAKREFGFDGVMVSDWGGAHDTMGCAMGGLDLEMGQGTGSIMGTPLLEMVKAGKIPETVIDEKVRRVLRLFYRTGHLEGSGKKPAKGKLDSKQSRAAAKKIASETMVLLKNDSGFLPLDSGKIKKILVTGPGAAFHHCMGPLELCGGSGAVHPAYEISPLDGLRSYGEKNGVEVVYAPGLVFNSQSVIPRGLLSHDDCRPGLKAEYFLPSAGDMRSAPALTRADQDMQLRWSAFTMVGGKETAGLPHKDFAVRWTGFLTPSASGESSLMVDCIHCHATVTLDGKQVISTDPKSRHAGGEYNFTAGAGKKISVVIEMRCPGENPEFKLLWRGPETDLTDAALAAATKADAVIFCGGTNHSYDKEAIGWGDVPGADIPDLELIGPQAELIGRLAKVNPNIAVVLINGSVVSVEPWIGSVKSVLDAWYPGMEGGSALAEMLFGVTSPSGKLCCTWGKRLNDYACHANGNYPGVRTGDSPYVNYDEGIFVGHRHFDKAGIEPRFPFGFGLSYTSFSVRLNGCDVVSGSVAAPEVKVKVTVKNTGSRAGAEVVQLYVSDDKCSVEREPKALKAFKKVFLKPGQTKRIEFKLSWRDFAFWSPSEKKWTVEPGAFTLSAGSSSRDIAGSERFELN